MLQFQFPTVKLQSGGSWKKRRLSPNWQVFAISLEVSRASLPLGFWSIRHAAAVRISNAAECHVISIVIAVCMEGSLWIQLPIVSDLFYSCCCSEKTRAQLKVVILRSWLAACKSAGNFDISGLSEVDVIACFRSALQNPDKAAKNRLPPSRNDALNMKQFSLMLLLLSARRLGRSEQGHDPTNCPVEWVEAVADMLMAIGFVSNSNAQEQSSATSSPPTLRSNDRDSNFRSPNASYLRGTMCRDSLDAPIQPHQLLTRSCSRSALQSRDGTLSQSQHRNESSKPMKFLWQPQMFSSNADVFASPGTYELPSYMRRDWELHRLRKSKSGKISMLVGLPPSRGRTARTFSDIKHIGQPQEVPRVLQFFGCSTVEISLSSRNTKLL